MCMSACVCVCVCLGAWVWPTVCDECECGAKGRCFHCRGHITTACLTSLQTHCLSIRFPSQDEGDPCAESERDHTNETRLRPWSRYTQCRVVGGGANERSGWRDLGFGLTGVCLPRGREGCELVEGWHLWPPASLRLYFMADRVNARDTDGILSRSLIYDPQLLCTNSAASCASDGP